MGTTPRVQDQPRSADDDVDLPGLLQQQLRSRGGLAAWTVLIDGVWCRVAPHGHRQRAQGWKLHVSATLPSAPTVLARALPVLLDAGCAFKFAATRGDVAELNTAHTPRGSSGKFVTAYPTDDRQAVVLAAGLHEATDGLAGPRILSDHPYRPGSLVHYRYGSFVDQRELSNDGIYRDVVYGPSGESSDDRRAARFAPPSWAPPVFGTEPAPDRAASKPRAVLLHGRFAVREAIRHANKGGVYRAHDLDHDVDVVIKEARPHVAVSPDGTDARDALRHEAQVLDVLAPLGICPSPIAVFDQGEHVFLVEELVPGVPLRRWALDGVRRNGIRAQLPAALPVAAELVSLLAATYAAGLVVRDFNPNNLIVRADGRLALLDLELAAIPGAASHYRAGGTPGYSAPEQFAGAAPAPTADLFSLGATIFFLLTGADPVLGEDEPATRPLPRRLADWLSVGVAAGLPAELRSLIVTLLADEPADRGDLALAGDTIAACIERTKHLAGQVNAQPSPVPATTESGTGEISDDEVEEAIDGIRTDLLRSMTPHDTEQLWPMAKSGVRNDPCNVQHGAAGVLAALTHCYRLSGDQRLPDVLATACDWIDRRRRIDPSRPPGLYFGSAGIAWALYDAGRAIRSAEITRRAVELAWSLPIEWPNPDLTHGTAGLGLTSLHLWQETGEIGFARRAAGSAHALLRSMRELGTGPGWEAPGSFDSVFAGQHHYGFAHGNAGIGYFLLACSAAHPLPMPTRRACLRGATAAASTLFGTALDIDGGARWGSGPGAEDVPLPYWCSGSAGVGTFLLRYGKATADARALRLAERAGRSAALHCWSGPLGQCHGVAGNAEYLLDLAALTGRPEFTVQARTLTRVIFARRCHRDGSTVFPDDTNDFSAEWAGGESGLLAFLLRLRHGGARRWMAEPPSWTVTR